MNESLINPFGISHPTAVQTQLYAAALFAKFDSTGRFIAAARANGAVTIWDLETRGPIRRLDGHVKAVTSIDWSRNSRYVLTSSKDWNVLIWDLASETMPLQRMASLRFDAPVVSATFHPKNSQIVLTLLATGEAFLCDLRKEHKSRVELLETLTEDPDEDDEMNGQLRPRAPMTVARFDPTGKHIWIGTASGCLLVFNTRTKIMIARHKISGATMMKGLEFTRSGRRLVTNSSDRTLRQFVVPTYPTPAPSSDADPATQPFIDMELEPTHRFSDPINKTAWHAMSYSPDGEWLAGGAADPAGHKIYVWDISNDGHLATALDGGKEPLVYVHWHPKKSALASTTNHGNILIWHHPTPERWGAFAGGFEEVDENVEYEEREDEFDIEDEAVILERKMKAEEQEVDIDTIINPSQSQPSGSLKLGTTSSTAGAGTQSGNMGGAATPVRTNPISSTVMTSSTGTGGPMDLSDAVADGMMDVSLDLDLDLDTVWAEEDPDGDEPDLWKIKIFMENDDGDELF